ncbi:DNA repair protein [Aureobasidium sp. EXF-10728]|nr:DNA repair protein [Aureobasidium sp. EXF-10728]
MANKRRYTSDHDTDDSSPPSSPKRPRVNGQRTEETPFETDEVDGGYTYQYHSHVNEDHTLHLDVSSDEAEDPESEIRATQLVQRHYQRNRENKAAEQGIIEDVYMENFMCHSKLRIQLGPLINFIIGHNGSGKSAILTALTICLGVKAAQTNRAGSLKNFIKSGEEHAYVAVKIKNDGDMAYQPADYGKSIIVERHFSTSGSGFKIKNAEGKIMSTKKAELENIVDFFALQLDNPMNVLSQDKAREFLSGSSPHDKYKFFIKGTQLEQLDSDYRILESQLDDTEHRCELAETDLEVLGGKAREAERKKKMIDQSQTMNEKINQLRWQHAWAQVEEQERELEKMDHQIRQVDNKITMQQAQADQASRLYDESHSTREANASVIADLEEQLGPLQDNHKEIKSIFDSKKSDMQDKKAEQRSIKQDMTTFRANMNNLETKINAERARIDNAIGPAHAQKVSDLEDARSQLEEIKQQEEQHAAQKAQIERSVADAQNEVNSARGQGLQQKRRAVEEADGMLQRLRTDQGQQAKAYPPQVHNVLRQIKNERGFTQQPVGPLGMHVRLLKPEWGPIIETICGDNLNSFVVRNPQDSTLLRRILNQQNCQSNVVINNGRHIDTSRHEPEQDLDTVLRVLEIDNDAVRNCLIINQAIDQTVLIPDRETANEFAQSRPRNVRSTICHHPHQRGFGNRYAPTRSGGISMGPVKPWPGQMRMKTSLEAQLNMAQERLNNAKRDLQEAENHMRTLEATLTRAKQAKTRYDRDTTNLRQQRQRHEDRIEQLQGELDADAVNDTGVLDELRAQYTEAEQSLQAANDTMMDSVNALDKLGEDNRQVKQQLDAASKEVEEAQAQLTKAQKRLEDKTTQREFALRKKNEALEMVDLARQEKEALEEQRNEQEKLINEEYLPGANLVSRRITVEPGNTVEVLDQKLEKLEKELQRQQDSIGGSREEIYKAWRAAHKRFASAQRALNSKKDVAKKLKAALIYRKNRWKLFRKHITTRAKITFNYLLSERNFRGRILVHHVDKTLDISVEPDISKNSDKGRQTKTLSGGEKSFSTICLLLSIWEAMGSPIRCLDEFDVFMDSANREISMKMMIQAARRSVGRQFVLITPQAMGKYTEGVQDVSVHKMADPERGQTTLNFSAA